MRYAIVSVVPWVSDVELARLATAYRLRGARTAAQWSPIFSDVTAPEVVIRGAVGELADGDTPFVLVSELPKEDAAFAAFHFVKPLPDGSSQPYGMILWPEGLPTSEGEDRFGHEADELLVDPPCTRYLAGKAVEVADPLEGVPDPQDLGAGDPVAFSAIVLGSWYGVGTGPTTSSGFALAAGANAPEGYHMNEDGSEVQGDGFRLSERKEHPLSRRMRRWRAISGRK